MRGKTRSDCDKEYCSAPLCPMDKDSLRKGIWYTDEEVCHCEKYLELRWVKRQLELKAQKAGIDIKYTKCMLNRRK